MRSPIQTKENIRCLLNLQTISITLPSLITRSAQEKLSLILPLPWHNLTQKSRQLRAPAGQALETGLGHGRNLIDDGAVAGGIRVGLLPPQPEGGIEGAGGTGYQVVVDTVDALALAILAG